MNSKPPASAEAPVRSESEWEIIIRADLDRAKESAIQFINGLISAGQNLTDAKRQIGHGRFGPMLKRLKINDRTARRLMSIASNQTIRNPDYIERLPQSVRTLAELATIPASTLEAYINDDVVHVDIERSDVEALKKALPGKNPPKRTRGSDSKPDEEETRGKPSQAAMEAKQTANAEAEAEELAAQEPLVEETRAVVETNAEVGAEIDPAATMPLPPPQNDEITALKARIADLECTEAKWRETDDKWKEMEGEWKETFEKQRAIIAKRDTEIATLRAGAAPSEPQPIEPQTLPQKFNRAVDSLALLDGTNPDRWPKKISTRDRTQQINEIHRFLARLRGFRDVIELYAEKDAPADGASRSTCEERR